MSNIEIEIEALVVEGFSHLEAYKIKQALETELNFLLRHHGESNLTTKDIQLKELRVGTINVQQGQNTTRVGQRIAGAIFQQLYQYANPARISSSQSSLQTSTLSAPMPLYNSQLSGSL